MFYYFIFIYQHLTPKGVIDEYIILFSVYHFSISYFIKYQLN
jgi:hypothetical protein